MLSAGVALYLAPSIIAAAHRYGILDHGDGKLKEQKQPVAYLGEISYAFYMLHWAILITFAIYGPRYGTHRWGFGWRWAACAGIAFVLAVACYHLYEIPLRDRLRRALSIKRPKAAPEAPAVLPFPVPAAAPDKRAA